MSAEIPIIDFSGFLNGTEEEQIRVANEIGEACEKIGFLVVKGHGVDPKIIQEAWEATQEFFDLPESEKLKYVTKDEAAYPFGYSAMGMESLVAGKVAENNESAAREDGKPVPDLKELFSLGPSNPAAGFPEREFPTQPKNFKESYTKYYDALAELGRKLLEAVTIPLKLPRDFFEQFITHHASALRALNYPALPEGQKFEENQMRASAHTDYGTFTILRSGGPGLQVCKDRNPPTWLPVPHLEGEDVFIINLGDLMRRWTNEHYCSTLHRVLPCPDRRQSMAFFHNLNRDAVVSNLIKGEADKYAPIKAGDFLMEKHLASLANSPTVAKSE